MNRSLAKSLRSAEAWSLLAAAGRFEISLSRDRHDIDEAQRLRYQVFYQEMGARPSPAMASAGRDFDDFDSICDHLLVRDRNRPAGRQVVGTYRLLRQEVAVQTRGFYSAGEYAIDAMLPRLSAIGGVMELGRSCVHADYRNNATIQLLWRGITAYMIDHAIAFMFGCASLPGTDPGKLAVPLSYLYHHHLAPPDLRVRALAERRVEMNVLPADQVPLRAALAALPPLIKAYLRLGAFIGDGAVIDHQFATTDVFILLPVARIAAKYYAHFERDGALTEDN